MVRLSGQTSPLPHSPWLWAGTIERWCALNVNTGMNDGYRLLEIAWDEKRQDYRCNLRGNRPTYGLRDILGQMVSENWHLVAFAPARWEQCPPFAKVTLFRAVFHG